MTGNRPELLGSHRSFEIVNPVVAQWETSNNCGRRGIAEAAGRNSATQGWPANLLLYRSPSRSGNASTMCRAHRWVAACGAVEMVKVPPTRVTHAPWLSAATSRTVSTRVNDSPVRYGRPRLRSMVQST
jgi:hypothetical protein